MAWPAVALFNVETKTSLPRYVNNWDDTASLTLKLVSPATDSTAVAVTERIVFIRETDGPDVWRSPHTPPIVLLQFDQNWQTETQYYEMGKYAMKQVADLETPPPHETDTPKCLCVCECSFGGVQGHSCLVRHSCAQRVGSWVSLYVSEWGWEVFKFMWVTEMCVTESYQCHVELDWIQRIVSERCTSPLQTSWCWDWWR